MRVNKGYKLLFILRAWVKIIFGSTKSNLLEINNLFTPVGD
jgi:hypothetical protein